MFDCINKALCLIPTYWVVPIINIPFAWLFDIIFIFWIMFFISWILKNQKYYLNWFLKKNTVYLIWWKFWNWKTRLLTQIWKDIKANYKNTIVYSNYHNWYSDLFFSSDDDFFKLQVDIQALGLYLNFTNEEKKEIENKFKNYFSFDKEYFEKHKKSLDKIKKIGSQINITWLCDEFHLYFYNRNFMKNFSWDKGRKKLETLHQTRHSNQLLIIATQETDTLDLDIRQIAEKEIEVKEWLNWFLFWFNIFTFLNSKEKTDDKQFLKNNKIPYLFLNKYLMFILTENLYIFYYKIEQKALAFYNKRFWKNLYRENKLLNPFEKYKLLYNTKFNINPSLNVYESGDLFKIIIEKNL